MRLTKNQLKVQGLLYNVQPLSDYKKEQAKKRCFPSPKMWVHGFRKGIRRGYDYESGYWRKCEYCGHEWTTREKTTDSTCPCCGSKLEEKKTLQQSSEEKSYFNVVTTCAEYQVVTLYMIKRYNHIRKNTFYNISELCQVWMNGKDYPVIFSVRKTFPYINDGWSVSTPIEMRQRAIVGGYCVYTKVVFTDRVHDWLKKKGFTKRNYCGYSPTWLFHKISKDFQYEVLLKNNGENFIEGLDDGEIGRYWPSIRVCLRHHYSPKDAQSWRDMISSLSYLGKDILNPHYICPENLPAMHDHWLKKKEELREKRYREEKMKKAKEQCDKFMRLKSRYFGIQFEHDGLVISVLSSLKEYEEEGKAMHNCVFQGEYYIKERTLCLSAKRNGKHVATIELDIATWKVIQCRAVCNKECEYQDEITELIEANKSVLEKAKRKKRKAA